MSSLLIASALLGPLQPERLVGTDVCVAAEVVKLRGKASADGDVRARLLRGDQVRVLSVGPMATVDGITAPWLQVDDKRARVWLFGGSVARLCGWVNVDGEGPPERLVVSELGSTALRVSVRAAGDAGWQDLVVESLGGVREPVSLRVDRVPAEVAGVPLLRVVQEIETPTHSARDVVLASWTVSEEGVRFVEALHYAFGGDDQTFSGGDLAFDEVGEYATLWSTAGGASGLIDVRQTRFRLVNGVFEPFGTDVVGQVIEEEPTP